MSLCLFQWKSIRVPLSRRQVGGAASECRRRAGSRSCSKGFTLIELMVVLVLIGILSAMIIPEMKGTYADALLRSSGRELVNVFKLAYSQAVSRNEIHVVRFEEKTGRFVVERRLGGERRESGFAPLKDVSGSSVDIDNRITVEVHKTDDDVNSKPEPDSARSLKQEQQSEHGLAFYPDGTADGAEILLRDQAGFGLRLRIDPLTARVEILELKQE